MILSAALCLTVMFSMHGTTTVPGSGCGSDECMKCHSLSPDEVKLVFQKIRISEAKLLKIQMSPVKGIWEVSFENKGERGLFYLDFSKKFLMSGSIIEVNVSINKTKERLNELNRDRKVNFSKIQLKNALVLGEKNAARKIAVFTDPDCPFCGKLHAELKKVVEKRKDIAFYIKLFPLRMHPDAYWKSKSIICNKSLELLEDNFDKKPIPQPNCKTDEVDKNIKLAGELGISSTPTLILPDGSVHAGFLEAGEIINMVDSIKKK